MLMLELFILFYTVKSGRYLSDLQLMEILFQFTKGYS